MLGYFSVITVCNYVVPLCHLTLPVPHISSLCCSPSLIYVVAPSVTVQQLEAAEARQGITPDAGLARYMAQMAQQENLVTDLTLKLLLLEHAANTIVGDAMIRGVSGGEKKRVTTGEMLVGGRRVGLYDEISTGLDSSSTFQIMLALRNITHALEQTTLVALLQPPPETVALFDDVWVLAGGRLVYQGPIDQVRRGGWRTYLSGVCGLLLSAKL